MSLFKKIKNMPPVVKATLIFGISSFMISGINYIFTPVFTRLLLKEEYGLISLYNTWYSFVQVVTSLTLIYPGVLNVGLYEHAENRYKYLSTMLGIVTSTTAVIFLVIFMFYNSISKLINIPIQLIILMMGMSLFHPAVVMWTQKQRYEYNYKLTVLITVGAAILSQIISVFAVIIFKESSYNLAVVRLWSAGIVNLIVDIVIYFYIFKKGKSFYDRDLWAETYKITIPLIPHYLSHVILNGTDKVMIERMVGIGQTGVYGLAATLSTLGILFWRALKISFSPFINKQLECRNFKKIDDLTKVLWIFSSLFCILGALLSPEIIKIFGTSEYLEAIYIMPPIAASVFMHVLYDSFSGVSFFHKQSKNIMHASVIAAIANIVLNYIFIKTFGYIAAAYTTLISNIILVLMHYVNIRKIEKEQIYNPKHAVAISLLCIIACLLCNFLYPITPIIRYIISFVICLVIYIKKGLLYHTISEMKV